MKKFLVVLFFILAFTFTAFAGSSAESYSPRGIETEVIMGYCTLEDLNGAYGSDRISAWSRLDPDAAERAIRNASSEIDGYLISGGYIVPLQGPPENLRKYCIDIAAAALILNVGVLENDPGGKAVLEEAKSARRYLTKVAEGKFRIPGAANFDKETSKLPAGGVRISASPRLDLRRF